MASIQQSFFHRFLLLLFIHLGCFAIFSARPSPNPEQEQPPPKRTRKIIPLSCTSNIKPHKSLISRSILSYLNHFLPFRKPDIDKNPISTTSSPLQSLLPLSPPTPDTISSQLVSTKHSSSLITSTSTSTSDIYPCTACGEVLTKPHLLELHQATKHSLSELSDGDSGKNIVQIIFRSGWKGKSPPVVHRILKIHNSTKTLARFDEYRQIVRSRAAARNGGSGDARCIADGNERLRFYCSTILCALGRDGAEITGSLVGVCGGQYCSTCGIVRHGFVGKHVDLDGIATHATSWGAHVSLPEELEREFAFLHVRRAVLVCRVVAGRVARGGEEAAEEKKGAVFDSVVPVMSGGGVEGSEELLVFNPRAVLPCFVIIYSA